MRCFRRWRERFPCSSWKEDHGETGSICSPWRRTMLEQMTTLQSMEDPTMEQVEMPWRQLQPVENPCWSRLLARIATCREEPVQEQVFWQELWPMGDPHWNILYLKDCTPWRVLYLRCSSSWGTAAHGKDPCWCSLWRTVSDWGAPHWIRGTVWGARSSRNKLLWTYHNPHSPFGSPKHRRKWRDSNERLPSYLENLHNRNCFESFNFGTSTVCELWQISGPVSMPVATSCARASRVGV